MKAAHLLLQKGFTLIELLLVMGVISILIGGLTFSVLSLRSDTAINTTVGTFITDLKNQQIKAMTGDTEGRGIPDFYGIYFEPKAYVLFHGETYSPLDEDNFEIPVDESLTIVQSFPDGTLVFSKQSGEIENFQEEHNSIIFQNDETGEGKTIEINKYGAIYSLN